jgi:hypothetical protein
MPEDHHSLEATQEALLAGAAAEATHLAEVSEQLLARIRMSKIERLYFVLMTLLLLLIGCGLLLLGVSNRSNTRASRQGVELIIDCTTAGHACYDRSQKSTADAVAAIVQSQLASSWCSSHSKNFDEAQKCVAVLLKPPKRP